MEKKIIGNKEYRVVNINILDNEQAIRDFSNLFAFGDTNGSLNGERAKNDDFVASIKMQDAYEATNGFVNPAEFKIFRYFALGQKASGQPITSADLQRYGDPHGTITLSNDQLIELVYGEPLLEKKGSHKRRSVCGLL